MFNPIIVYTALGLYAVLFACLFAYVHNRFRKSSRILNLLQNDWAEADSRHVGLIERAQDKLASLASEPGASQPQMVPAPSATVTTDARRQVLAMGRKGFGVSEIARSAGLAEGEVDVLLGLARMQR